MPLPESQLITSRCRTSRFIFPPSYPGMSMDATTQTAVLRDYVLPAFTNANLTTQVLVYDHNWDTPSYPETVFTDSTILASPLVAGTAWHGYGGTPGAQQTVQNMFPTKGTWETEHSGGTWVTSPDQFITDFVEITQVMRNASKSFVKWSLALNENLGPNLTQNDPPYGGCNTCTPLITVNSTTGAVTKDVEYYTIGHYSKYVLPGAKRIYSSNTNGIVSVGFLNPDGSKALIAFNNTALSNSFYVQWGTQAFPYTLASHSAATFTWSGTQSGVPAIPATSLIQASSYSSQTGLQTEATSDSSGGYDLGYLTNGATAVYNNVDFGSGVTKVNVRTASAGTGATATFYLDSTIRRAHCDRDASCNWRLANLADGDRKCDRSIWYSHAIRRIQQRIERELVPIPVIGLKRIPQFSLLS